MLFVHLANANKDHTGIAVSNERYKSTLLIPPPMQIRHLMVVLVLLLLVACSKNTITGRALDAAPTAQPTPEVTAPAEDTEEELPVDVDETPEPDQFADVTDVPTYELRKECTTDSKGVVRYFDENGLKTVYRNECYGGFLTSYRCEGNQVLSENKVCSGECKQGPYGDTC